MRTRFRHSSRFLFTLVCVILTITPMNSIAAPERTSSIVGDQMIVVETDAGAPVDMADAPQYPHLPSMRCEAARTATGCERLIEMGGVVLTGRSNDSQVDGTFRLEFTASGSFLLVVDSPMPRTCGFDGQSVWAIDSGWMPRLLVLDERDDELVANWLATGLWLLDMPGLHLTPGAADEVIGFTLGDGKMSGEVTLDPTTGLPTSAFWLCNGSETRLSLAAYREWNGLALPTVIEFVYDETDTMRLEVMEIEAASVLEDFSPRLDRPGTVNFDPSVPPLLTDVISKHGFLLVKPLIDGRDVGWFIFDSGAGGCIINTSVIDDLGWEPVCGGIISGVGGEESAFIYRASSLSLGSLRVDSPLFVGFDLEDIGLYFDLPLGGIVGYGVLAPAVVEFDFVEESISVHDPDLFDDSDLVWQELTVYRNQPWVRAEFEGHQGIFALDTGAPRSGLSIHPTTVMKYGLLADRQGQSGSMSGIGGQNAGQRSKMENFRLGGRTFTDVPTLFLTESEGALNNIYTDGNIEGRLLRAFHIVFDYSRRRICFQPH
ncbi:MAG: hypothetical protein GY835_14135 [bacterium]|nr:hypothetical protein [bacterium]